MTIEVSSYNHRTRHDRLLCSPSMSLHEKVQIGDWIGRQVAAWMTTPETERQVQYSL